MSLKVCPRCYELALEFDSYFHRDVCRNPNCQYTEPDNYVEHTIETILKLLGELSKRELDNNSCEIAHASMAMKSYLYSKTTR